MNKKLLHAPACLLAGLLLMAVPAHAASVSVTSGVGDTLVNSAGLNLDASFTFQIGSFVSGFTPDVLNVSLWEANWKPFAQATAPAVNGWNTTARYFSSGAEFQVGGTSSAGLGPVTFSQGEQLYLWVFDTRAISATAEWALVTNNSTDGNAADNWVLPNPSDLTAGVGDFLLGSASVSVVGGANNNYGGGTITNPLGSFQLQTALIPVPEPGAAMLLAITGVLVTLKRRRHSSRRTNV